jgi:hypothetical protein
MVIIKEKKTREKRRNLCKYKVFEEEFQIKKDD